MAQRLLAWLQKSPVDVIDLAWFRIIFASAALILWPTYSWVAAYPDTFFDPPPGPFFLLPGFVPLGVLVALDVLIRVAFALILVGAFTRLGSVSATVLMMLGEGISFSMGKIDHSIMFVLVPLFFGLAGWGETRSFDARLRSSADKPIALRFASAPRLFAAAAAVAFLTSAAVKIRGGWLDLSTQASYGYQIQQTHGGGKDDWLAPILPDLHVPFIWETLDLATVALEGALILCFLWWRAWRIGLALMCFFHLGVYLSFNIAFWMNIVTYAAFVPWGRVFAWVSKFMRSHPTLVAGVAVVAVTVVSLLLGSGELHERLTGLIVFAGVGTAAVVLVLEVMSWVRPKRQHQTSEVG